MRGRRRAAQSDEFLEFAEREHDATKVVATL